MTGEAEDTGETGFRLDESDEVESDIYININSTEYFSDEKLKTLISQKRDDEITTFCWNIRSLPKRFTELTSELSMLNFSPDIIALCETKITSKVNCYYKPYLPNYVYYKSESSTHSGSVGVFINDSFSVYPRNDLDISQPGIFETVWFDIEHKIAGKKAL